MAISSWRAARESELREREYVTDALHVAAGGVNGRQAGVDGDARDDARLTHRRIVPACDSLQFQFHSKPSQYQDHHERVSVESRRTEANTETATQLFKIKVPKELANKNNFMGNRTSHLAILDKKNDRIYYR